ncbi:MAG: hypothetical protein ACFFD2_01380 [Promethearchaeota archaeon]
MRWKTQRLTVLFLFITSFIIITYTPFSLTTDVDYIAPYRLGAGPDIDGSITTSEWVNSTKYDLTFGYNDTENPFIEVELYLLHNGSALFIGINVTTTDNQSDDADAFCIYFDEEHNAYLGGNATHPKEDGLRLTRDGNITDLSYNGIEWINDESIENLTKGPSYGATNSAGEWEFIIISSYDPLKRISTNSSDFDVNFPSNVVEHAVEIGFNIEYYDADIDQYDSFTTSANGTVNNTPALWNNLIFDIIPYSPPNTSIIWIFIVVAMIIPAGLILYILIWLKRKKLP